MLIGFPQAVDYFTLMLVAAASYSNATRLSYDDIRAAVRTELAGAITLHNTILTGHPPRVPAQVYLFYDERYPTQRLFGSTPVTINQSFVDMVAEYFVAGMLSIYQYWNPIVVSLYWLPFSQLVQVVTWPSSPLRKQRVLTSTSGKC